MSLLTVDELRAQVNTGVDDTDLQMIIDREEAEIISRYGAHYVDANTAIVETCDGGGCSLYLKRRVLSVTSITEAQSLGGATTTLSSTQYYAYPGQGRIARLSEGTRWGRSVVVTYVPADDRPLRISVLIEIVRQALEQTAMAAESVAGEYSFTAPDWEKQRRRLYKRLEFPSI
jgi:hypothetical protein